MGGGWWPCGGEADGPPPPLRHDTDDDEKEVKEVDAVVGESDPYVEEEGAEEDAEASADHSGEPMDGGRLRPSPPFSRGRCCRSAAGREEERERCFVSVLVSPEDKEEEGGREVGGGGVAEGVGETTWVAATGEDVSLFSPVDVLSNASKMAVCFRFFFRLPEMDAEARESEAEDVAGGLERVGFFPTVRCVLNGRKCVLEIDSGTPLPSPPLWSTSFCGVIPTSWRAFVAASTSCVDVGTDGGEEVDINGGRLLDHGVCVCEREVGNAVKTNNYKKANTRTENENGRQRHRRNIRVKKRRRKKDESKN